MSLYLGHPTAIKMSDLSVERLTNVTDRATSPEYSGQAEDVEMQIFETLVDFMALCGKIIEEISRPKKVTYATAALDQELSTWHSQLPPRLVWSSENIQSAPASYFLLQ